MKYIILLLLAVCIGCSTSAYGHDGDKPQVPEKVSSAMMRREARGTTRPEQVGGAHEGDRQTAEDKVVERDLDTIRADVQSSTTLVLIKALGLGVAVIWVAAAYLPRKRKGNS